MVGGLRHVRGPTFCEPTVLAVVTTKMLLTREEAFGPIAGRSLRRLTEALHLLERG